MLDFSRAALTKLQLAIIIAVICVAAIGGGYFYLQLQKPAAPEVIKIGWVAPLTGPLGPMAKAVPWVVSKLEEAINKEGGIYMKEYGKKIPVKIILKDSQSDASIAASVAADLITREGVNLITAVHAPATVLPVASQAEKYHVPCVVTLCPFLSWVDAGPYEWVYMVFPAEVEICENAVQLIGKIINKTNGVIGTLYLNDADGKNFHDVTVKRLRELGYAKKIVDPGFIALDTKEFGSIIETFRREKVEIIVGNVRSTEFLAFWRQCHEMGYIPKYLIVSRAAVSYTAIKALGGDLPNGIITEWYWNKYLPFKSSLTGQTAAEFADEYERENNEFYTYAIGCYHMLGEIFVDVLKRAGTIDKDRLREAIANIDLMTIYGRVCFKTPLTPERLELWKDYPKALTMKDHWCTMPCFFGQWVKGTKWDWENVLVINAVFKEYQVPLQEPIPIPGSG